MRNSVEQSEILYQNASLQEQIKELVKDLNITKKRLGKVADQVVTVEETINNSGGIVNLLNNGDFQFDDTVYNAATYGGSDDTAAEWYAKTQGTADWLPSALPATSSAQILRNDNTLNTYWNKVAQEANIGGGYLIGQKFASKVLTAGTKFFVRFRLSKKAGATVDSAVKIRLSAYDNTAGQKKIIEGQTQELTASRQGTAGTYTRKYILEIVTASGSFFSNVTAPVQVTDALSVDDNSNTVSNYVLVSWNAVLEQQSCKLYRHDSQYNEWRKVADITSGNTSFRDVGGNTGTIFVPPTTQSNPKALVEIANIGAILTESPTDTTAAIQIPSTYNYSATVEQWFQIEFLKADGSPSTTAEIPLGAIIIDKVGLSNNNGNFSPSAKDREKGAI